MGDYIFQLEGTTQTAVVNKPDFDGDWWTRYFPNRGERWVFAYTTETRTPNGIIFTSELSGADGAHFTLFVRKGTRKEQVDEAKRWLRHTQDVTGFTTVSLNLPKKEYDNIKTAW